MRVPQSVGRVFAGSPRYYEVAAQRPLPIGRGPLACVARDQICDRHRLSRSAPSHMGRNRGRARRFSGRIVTGRDT